VRRRGQHRLDVAGLLVVPGGDVVGDVGVHRVPSLAGGVHADDDRQLLVGDDDPLGGVLGEVPVGRDDHDDGLADVVHLAVGQRVASARGGQLRMRDQHGQRLGHRTSEVFVGVDRDQALDVERAFDVDVGDPRVRVRRPHERGGQRGVPDVVQVPPATDDQTGVLPTADRLTEELGGHRRPPTSVRTAEAAALPREPQCRADPAAAARLWRAEAEDGVSAVIRRPSSRRPRDARPS
jgi:hypothetical protein